MQYRKLESLQDMLSNVNRYMQLSRQFRSRQLSEILAGHAVYEEEHSLKPVTFTWHGHNYKLWFRCVCGKRTTIARRCVMVDDVVSNGNVLRKVANAISFELAQQSIDSLVRSKAGEQA